MKVLYGSLAEAAAVGPVDPRKPDLCPPNYCSCNGTLDPPCGLEMCGPENGCIINCPPVSCNGQTCGIEVCGVQICGINSGVLW